MKQVRKADWEDVTGGVMLPLILLAGGLACLITGTGLLLDLNEYSGGPLLFRCRGAPAVALGLVCLSGAAFLHCRYFWNNLYASPFATGGQIAAAAGFGLSLLYLILHLSLTSE